MFSVIFYVYVGLNIHKNRYSSILAYAHIGRYLDKEADRYEYKCNIKSK